MNRMSRIASAATVAVFAATLVCGCQVTRSSVEPPQGVKVSIYQPRSDISMNRIAIKFQNDSAEPLTITAASLTSNFFASEFVWDSSRAAAVSPGFAIDLRIDIPPVDSCDESKTVTEVRFDWSVGEKSGTSFITPDDTFSILDSLHNNGCFISAMNKVSAITAVSLTLPSQKLAPATLLISIAPTGEEETMTINSVGSTTLLTPADSNGIGTAQLDLDVVISAKGPFKLNVPIVPNRCDAHGIAEDKIGTRIPLLVTLADGTQGRFALPASNQLRAAIYSFYTSFCGLG
jgi:hypothetical protein